MSLFYVKAGACFDAQSGDFLYCCFDSDDCQSDIPEKSVYFVSSQAISEEASSKTTLLTTKARDCLRPQAKLDIPIGRCTSTLDDQHCTGTASGCNDRDQFSSRDKNCGVVSDRKQNRETHYGVCWSKDDIKDDSSSFNTNFEHKFCSWSQEDCPVGNYAWEAVNNVNSLGGMKECMCEDVNVGACVRSPVGKSDVAYPEINDIYYCAVSERACTQDDEYLTAIEVLKRKDFQCRLCEPILAGGGMDAEMSAPARTKITYNNNNATDYGVLIGITICFLVSLLIVLITSKFYPSKAHRQQQHQNDPAQVDTGNVIEFCLSDDKLIL